MTHPIATEKSFEVLQKIRAEKTPPKKPTTKEKS